MPQSTSPLLDQYNQDGIVTPSIKRVLDMVRRQVPQFPGLSDSPEATRTLQPPTVPAPSIARGTAPAPGLVSPGGPPTQPAPFSGAPSTPLINNPESQKHLTELNRLTDTGSGISQVHNPIARGLLRAADITGSAFFPNITSQIPGTELHHEGLVRRAEGTVDKDVARAKENASTAETEARTGAIPGEEALRTAQTSEANARTASLEHPRPKDLTDLYLRDNPKATAADLATFMQKDYETRENARAATEAANRQPNQYADFKAGFLKQNPNATPDQVVEAFKKSQKTATETSAEDDQKYEGLVTKKNLGQKLTPEEEAQVKAYRDRKTIGQQVTNVYANERAEKGALSKDAAELHKTLMGEFSTARTQLDNVAQARADLSANPVGQNIGTIKTIVALAGGKGSGVRITQPELNSLASNLGIKTSFANWLSSIEGQGKFSPETLRQISQVLDGVEKLGKEKETRLNGALDSLQDAKSKDDVNRIEREYRHGIGQGGEQKVITATNPQTKEKLESTDGGVTWHKPQQ